MENHEQNQQQRLVKRVRRLLIALRVLAVSVACGAIAQIIFCIAARFTLSGDPVAYMTGVIITCGFSAVCGFGAVGVIIAAHLYMRRLKQISAQDPLDTQVPQNPQSTQDTQTTQNTNTQTPEGDSGEAQ